VSTAAALSGEAARRCSGEAARRCQLGAAAVTYLEAGKGSPLVLLHGIGSAARSFRDQLDGLSAGHRVVAWDAPGYGGSTALEAVAPTADDYAERLAAFLDALGIGSCHLLGHSLGCLMAARFAVRHPARVLSLSLCSVAAGHGLLADEERRRLLAQRIDAVAKLGPAEMARQRGPRLVAPGAPADILQRVIDTMAAVRPDGYAQAARMLSTADIKADVARLVPALPLQIVYGEADIITPPARNLEVAALRPGAPVAVVPGAGHALYLEQPQAFNAIVAGFLAAKD
jgi:pimeloyl-ACP methyl ester carboxylesterase